jgi:hypothetical protein
MTQSKRQLLPLLSCLTSFCFIERGSAFVIPKAFSSNKDSIISSPSKSSLNFKNSYLDVLESYKGGNPRTQKSSAGNRFRTVPKPYYQTSFHHYDGASEKPVRMELGRNNAATENNYRNVWLDVNGFPPLQEDIASESTLGSPNFYDEAKFASHRPHGNTNSKNRRYNDRRDTSSTFYDIPFRSSRMHRDNQDARLPPPHGDYREPRGPPRNRNQNRYTPTPEEFINRVEFYSPYQENNEPYPLDDFYAPYGMQNHNNLGRIERYYQPPRPQPYGSMENDPTFYDDIHFQGDEEWADHRVPTPSSPFFEQQQEWSYYNDMPPPPPPPCFYHQGRGGIEDDIPFFYGPQGDGPWL